MHRQIRKSKSGKITVLRKLTLPGALAMVCLFLSACSDGGGGGDSSGLVPGDSNATPADQLTTEEILQGAADTTSSGLGQRLIELQDATDDALTELESGSPVAGMVDQTDTTIFTDLDTQNTELLSTSLGLDGSNTEVLRTGNTITIDPDEQALCADTVGSSPEQDTTSCSQLMADLTVRVEAITEDSGVIVYLFRNQPLLSIGYAPNGATYELELATLSTVLQAEAELDDAVEDSQEASISGTVRLSAKVSSEGTSNESAELSLQVVNALSVVDNSTAQTLLSLQPSTVFQINTDTASESVVTQIDWGALQITDDFLGSNNSRNELMLNLGKLTGQVSASGSGGPVQISNIGIGDVPLSITINSVESISFGLDTFGASLDNDTGILTLSSALGLQYVVDNLANTLQGLPDQYRLEFSASAPAGTGFQAQDNGSTRVTSGGPFTATSVSSDSTQSSQDEITVQAGECFDDVDDEQTIDATDSDDSSTDNLIPTVVPCS